MPCGALADCRDVLDGQMMKGKGLEDLACEDRKAEELPHIVGGIEDAFVDSEVRVQAAWQHWDLGDAFEDLQVGLVVELPKITS